MFKKGEENVVQKGNIGTFFLGVLIFAAGLFMVLNNTVVGTNRGMGYGYGRMIGWAPPFGVLILPLLIGIIILVASNKQLLGWFFVCIGLLIILIGILTAIDFTFKTTSAYYMIIMFGFVAVGIGMIIRGLIGRSN